MEMGYINLNIGIHSKVRPPPPTHSHMYIQFKLYAIIMRLSHIMAHNKLDM